MNKLLRILIMIWLGLSATFVWVGCAILGFMCTFVNNIGWMVNITPFIGLSSAICIILVMIRVNRSNPADFIISKWESLIGKAKIQR